MHSAGLFTLLTSLLVSSVLGSPLFTHPASTDSLASYTAEGPLDLDPILFSPMGPEIFLNPASNSSKNCNAPGYLKYHVPAGSNFLPSPVGVPLRVVFFGYVNNPTYQSVIMNFLLNFRNTNYWTTIRNNYMNKFGMTIAEGMGVKPTDLEMFYLAPTYGAEVHNYCPTGNIQGGVFLKDQVDYYNSGGSGDGSGELLSHSDTSRMQECLGSTKGNNIWIIIQDDTTTYSFVDEKLTNPNPVKTSNTTNLDNLLCARKGQTPHRNGAAGNILFMRVIMPNANSPCNILPTNSSLYSQSGNVIKFSAVLSSLPNGEYIDNTILFLGHELVEIFISPIYGFVSDGCDLEAADICQNVIHVPKGYNYNMQITGSSYSFTYIGYSTYDIQQTGTNNYVSRHIVGAVWDPISLTCFTPN